MKYLIFVSVFFLGMACSQKTNLAENAAEKVEKVQKEESMSYFGDKISPDQAVSYEQMVAKLAGQDSMEIKVKGTVAEVCQAKGCWMNIVSNDTGVEPMMVRFKDYGFFVPKDISGKTVIIEGKAFKSVTSVEELQHYAKDGGASKEAIEAIKEPKVETKFLASGVILLDGK